MSALLKFFWAMTFTRSARTLDAGSLSDPVKAVTIDALGTQLHEESIPVPAGGSAIIYAYDPDGPWDFLALQVDGGEGFVYTKEDIDSPEAADDPAPSGDDEESTQKMGLSCFAPKVYSSRLCKVNSGADDGFIYGITVYNEGAEDVSVTVWRH